MDTQDCQSSVQSNALGDFFADETRIQARWHNPRDLYLHPQAAPEEPGELVAWLKKAAEVAGASDYPTAASRFTRAYAMLRVSVATLEKIALVAHGGGLIGYADEAQALNEIRRLTNPYVGNQTAVPIA